MRIIGDIHQNYNRYYEIINNCNYSIQIGDMGYDYSPIKNLKNHKFIGGNHENWNNISECENYLGRFGYTTLDNFNFFFVSGGFSIDWSIRKRKEFEWGKTWFPNEELDRKEQDECLKLYSEIKPKILIAHEAPRSIVSNFSNENILIEFGYNPATFSTETSELLDRMLEVHKPRYMFMGHYHVNWQKEIDGTLFHVIKDGDYYDFEEKL